jgi:hypothetical protein
MAGVIFYGLWVPIVLISATMVRLQSRTRLIAGADDPSVWRRAVVGLLALGLPVAVGFGFLFTLDPDNSGPVLIGIFVVICVGLAALYLRLRRW